MPDGNQPSDEAVGERKGDEPDVDGVSEKFDRQQDFGDIAYLYQSVTAWSVNPRAGFIAPITRIAVADLDGNLLFQRSVVLTGIADLVHELSRTLHIELTKLSEMKDLKVSIPGHPKLMMDNLRAIQDRIGNALALAEKLTYDVVGDADEPSGSDETAKPAAEPSAADAAPKR